MPTDGLGRPFRWQWRSRICCGALAYRWLGRSADRFGTAKVVALGAAVYSVGIAGMAMSDSGLALHVTGGILVGLGVAFCSFSLVLAAIARLIGPARRSLALGLGTAAGSLGQVIFSPINQALISRYGWYDSLLVMSVVSLVLIPLAFSLRGSSESRGEPASDQGLTNALGEAVNHRSYLLLTAGFFVCGFHVAFITVHFPRTSPISVSRLKQAHMRFH